MRTGHFVSSVVTGSVAGAVIGLLMLPRRKRSSLMRQGLRLWAKGSKVWH